ncbi:MAG TPA: sensor histidine kinase, partial [Beijerinckiaceae bacterium]|nr:sensor histidine kinase [Beijerinckiaceae bacterium]
PKVRLRPKAAEMLGLAMHELATNAVKYGALAADGGRIAVNWTIEDGDKAPLLRLIWTETGAVLDGGPPTRRGFGTELLERTLAYELDAATDLAFQDGGLRCTVAVPLTDRIALAGATRKPA